MTTFLRPGQQAAAAFGLAFDVDRDASGAAPAAVFNKNDRLAISDQRQRLPIYAHRTELLYLVETHATTVVVGETGSGKTTQIPQYLHEAGWTQGDKMIACTQPRRVAAMTVATRVAEEMGCRLGQQVGYSIRFEDVSTPEVTKVRFCTDGVLLREMMSDPLLLKYSVVMVDEAHERSLATDVLLGLLKKIQRRRPDLRVIISSATIEAEKMARFFDTSNVRRPRGHAEVAQEGAAPSRSPALMSVEGRTHNVQIHYLEAAVDNYLQVAVETSVAIHKEDLPGDILIFLTGQDECEAVVKLLEEEGRRLQRSRLKWRLQPMALYAGLSAPHQLAAFDAAPRGVRKVVVSTNIAETSVTLEGIVYVIDSCFAKQRCYNPLTGLESLLIAPISKASAQQRAGRAGRVRPGHCLRLCTEADYEDKLPATTVPEMQRSDLSGTVLQLKSLGIDNVMTFEWLAPPPAETMIRALETLHALGALDEDVRLARPIGLQMAELPLDPVLARMLLAAGEMGCTAEVLTVVAMLSVQSIWAGGGRRDVDEAKARFAVAEGDLVSYLNVWRAWEESKRSKKWAVANHVMHRSLLRAADIRSQLQAHLRRLGFKQASALEGATSFDHDQELDIVRKALAAGMFINAARLTEETQVKLADQSDTGAAIYRLVRSAGGDAAAVKLRIHHSSVLFRCRPAWVCFYAAEQNDTGWYEMRDVLAIESGWLTELAGHVYRMVPLNPQMRR
ncbi:hypothetical protein D9Q98_008996 [Chlorella vulgaris]|uniref:RNA helicase n=1 Tax=Chlorella vulgaris TaxID=3077 RepID=A0A9D4YTE2_CHLVU|nr:hypothetical protein D9Q98_008996 [Chlorella vulgaris]